MSENEIGLFEAMCTLLGLPANTETAALSPIGYPKGKYGPTACRLLGEGLPYQRWDAPRQ